MNRRNTALQALLNIVQGQTLHQALPTFSSPQDEAWVLALLEGSCRFYFQIKTLLNVQLLKQPFSPKDQDMECLLILALYELNAMRSQPYAVVNEWVNLTKTLKKASYTPVINAICRRYEREKDTLPFSAYPNVPSWLGKKYRKHYGEQASAILEAQDQDAPLFLRINTQKISLPDFLSALKNEGYEANTFSTLPTCVMLEKSGPIHLLPGYTQGWFYVQDYSAQWAASLLDCQPNQTLLDVCAAPGGKTLHALEQQPSLQITATDCSAARLQTLSDNLQRCGGQVTILEKDMTQSNHGFPPASFDRILLDAPCSGTGVIRRHPDIKVSRHSDDIPALLNTQACLLETSWPLLKVGGILLYVTCSLLPEENEEQILSFLAKHPDACLDPFTLPHGLAQKAGHQILPEVGGGDGFYYARIKKI